MLKYSNRTADEVLKIVQSLSLSGSTIEPKPEDDLFDSGSLDSVVIVGLLTELESHFTIKIPSTEFSPENFSTIAGIAALVERVKNQK